MSYFSPPPSLIWRQVIWVEDFNCHVWGDNTPHLQEWKKKKTYFTKAPLFRTSGVLMGRVISRSAWLYTLWNNECIPKKAHRSTADYRKARQSVEVATPRGGGADLSLRKMSWYEWPIAARPGMPSVRQLIIRRRVWRATISERVIIQREVAYMSIQLTPTEC